MKGDGKSRVFVTQSVVMDCAKGEKNLTVHSGVLTGIQKVCLPEIYKKYEYYYPT